MSQHWYNEEGYSKLEEWLHSITHGIGAVLSLTGMVALLVMTSITAHVDAWKLVSFSIYGLSLILLYTASSLYHGVQHPRLKKLFKLFDHCAIFLLIAGTYTPFLLVNMRGPIGWTLFVIIWSLAIGGITLKLLWPERFRFIRVMIYLLMGWLIVFAYGDIVANISPLGMNLLVSGGVIYTVGVLFYLVRQIPFNHTIWHLFCIGGSVCHYFAMVYGVLPQLG
ncbi:hemolysin III [Terasakiispira papahanaumokuakeensis]|uniref:Hemolysin III n=1 Tax=Terasakiispira papahanaumokuakeensis TaxID=197479 RepID=A0A1E2V9N3_9GAMM|nr:hemolysin III family protein [Terasakiispira papahanaumokuakeensis]ODC03729.1 hemolysin III [Terasakiispira papahanaumokuakeensis]